MSKYHCLWCGVEVAHRGDTCCFQHYEAVCAVLALGEPYLADNDDPPNTIQRQPWYRKVMEDDARLST